MSARLIDGTAIAAGIREEIARGAAELVAASGAPPGLGVLLVGDDPASAIYVRMKTAACDRAGFHSEQVNLPADASQEDVLAAVERFNADPRIHGILVQLPLPPHVDEDTVVRAVDPAKDADGLHPDNVARLAMGLPKVLPCTPAGVMELLRREGVELSGREAVVVGRSNLVGRPVARLLLLANDPARRRAGAGGGEPRPGLRGHGEARGDGHRCRHQPPAARRSGRQGSSRRRCRPGVHRGGGGTAQPRPRRGRPDDHRHAAAEHPRCRAPLPGLKASRRPRGRPP